MWEKRLLLCFIINAFNVHNVFPYLHISLKTTNTSESFSMHTLVDFEATRVFINRSFVEKRSLNTQSPYLCTMLTVLQMRMAKYQR